MVDINKFLSENNLKIVDNLDLDNKNSFVLILEGDVNDGDYVKSKTYFDLNYIEDFKLVLDTIKNYKDNWFNYLVDLEDMYFEDNPNLSDEEKEIFEQFEMLVSLPSDSYGFCHTITDMSFEYIDELGVVHKLEYDI